MRSSNGCWTCRLRRKKCDENRPVCDACSALGVTCHNNLDCKPEWMDGSVKQEEMAKQLKRDIKESGRHRRGESAVHISGDRASSPEASPDDGLPGTPILFKSQNAPRCNLLNAAPERQREFIEFSSDASTLRLQRGTDCTLTGKGVGENIAFGRWDSMLLAFYFENLLPFLFPFYHPSILQGGRAWIFEMMISSPVVRQATLCQSSYFFSLAQGATDSDAIWDKVLLQTNDAFGVLRQALQVIDDSDIAEHLHGAVRIKASIMQMQCFESAVLRFQNWQTHLNAALALFEQLLDSMGDAGEPVARFDALMNRLGPQSDQVPSAEQAAFRFSSALVIFDDIIASTALQQQPKLYKYHRSLLRRINGTGEPAIKLESVVGLRNWTALHIGEIAALEAWKQQCRTSGNLDVAELVRRATSIKESLGFCLMQLETDTETVSVEVNSLLDVFTPPPNQTPLVTRVWAHAALLYLCIVVSGWQPASVDVRYHVTRVVELLSHQKSPALLRTMVWPFCVAGCLANPTQEALFRDMVKSLQPPSIFGTVYKAFEIMQSVWQNRNAAAAADSVATCFRSQGELVLLV